QHVAADADAMARVEHAAGVDHRATADHHVAGAAGRFDLDECVDHHVVLDDDASAAHRVLDIGQWRHARGAGDPQHGYSAAMARPGAPRHSSHNARHAASTHR